MADPIERSFASLLWHHPQHIAAARRELDFALHISHPAYRKIIEAIENVYAKIGEADWVCVLHCIREMGASEACGGLEGLNQVFTDGDRYPEGRTHPEPLFYEYLKLLKAHAVQRETDPYQSVRHFTRGHGYLKRNKLATKSTHPPAVGKIPRCCCGLPCVVAGWPAGEEDTLNLTLDLER